MNRPFTKGNENRTQRAHLFVRKKTEKFKYSKISALYSGIFLCVQRIIHRNVRPPAITTQCNM
jgi:hypothetical protein